MSTQRNRQFVSFVRDLYGTQEFIPLHEPRFDDSERELLLECIDSTFVSSVGAFVDAFEEGIASYTGTKHAVAVVNGTQALFVALRLAGAREGTEVITQGLTFIATANATRSTGACPVFLDVDRDSMGLSPAALREFLESQTEQKSGSCWNRGTGRKVVACVPMHTFGHPCRIQEVRQLCVEHNIVLVEDAAESLGSHADGKHTGSFGTLGILSFNGNKIITTGGGGMIVTDDPNLAKQAKHLTTTAKVPHRWEFIHDHVGYNFRMPNINAALGVAQLRKLPEFVASKRKLADAYREFCSDHGFVFVGERPGTRANYWLNALVLEDERKRNEFLEFTNDSGVMTRCAWRPMNRLPMYADCQADGLQNTSYLYERLVNIPSSAIR